MRWAAPQTPSVAPHLRASAEPGRRLAEIRNRFLSRCSLAYNDKSRGASGMGQTRHFRRSAEPVASTPNGLDIVFAVRRLR